MRFLLYASYNETGIRSSLGKPDYSYWFVQQYFERLLSAMDETVVLDDRRKAPRTVNLDEEVLFLFMPPHKIPAELVDSAIPVIAWEFDTVPDEDWDDDFRNNWYNVLERSPGGITHCGFTADTVKARLGSDYPMAMIPSPIWDDFSNLHSPGRDPLASWSIDVSGVIVDSRVAQRDEDAGMPLNVSNPENEPRFAQGTHRLDFEGVTYSFVFNPTDGRKEWMDAVSAFVDAFEFEPRATLILKLIQVDLHRGAPMVWKAIAPLGHFACRIVVIQAHLNGPSYEALISKPTYVINTSRGEGQCLPLLESMSTGVPAVSPNHTAMADYVNERNSFVVRYSRRWASWPHDPRSALRSSTFPVVWESLREKLVESFECAVSYPAMYRSRSAAAFEEMRRFCSLESTRAAMTKFLDDIRARRRRMTENT